MCESFSVMLVLGVEAVEIRGQNSYIGWLTGRKGRGRGKEWDAERKRDREIYRLTERQREKLWQFQTDHINARTPSPGLSAPSVAACAHLCGAALLCILEDAVNKLVGLRVHIHQWQSSDTDVCVCACVCVNKRFVLLHGAQCSRLQCDCVCGALRTRKVSPKAGAQKRLQEWDVVQRRRKYSVDWNSWATRTLACTHTLTHFSMVNVSVW